MVNIDKNKNSEFLQILHRLICDWESEVVEFKEANDSFSQHDVGKYFSAISNEARLKELPNGWLIFGVNNKTFKTVGTNYRDTRRLESLKHEIAQNATGGITFSDIVEVYDGEFRIVMFKIPAAVSGIPTAWKGHYYGRDGESLSYLSLDELDRLRGQMRLDWSKQVIDNSGVQYLDKNAIQVARNNYKAKHSRAHISTEIDKMSDEEFLAKVKLLVNGKLTNAAMVLLGNPDHDNIIDVPIRIMWRLYGSNGMVKDYFEYRMPFITVVDQVYTKIRNLVYRYMPNQLTLFTTEVQQYDEGLIKELLNNCIAHQDYSLGGRIYLDEFEDTVIISNPGSFIPGNIQEVLKAGYRAPFYRNQLLSDAMKEFDMIDTVQMGILRVYNIQRDRYFPLPDYDLHSDREVSVKVYGKILDKNYTRLLFDNDSLSLEDVFLLDRVQKKLPLEKEQYKSLRKIGLIEGKIPNVYVSLAISMIIGEQPQYTKNKALDDKYYADLIVQYLQQFGSGKKADFIKLLGDKLSDVLDDKQKENKVRSLLRVLHKNEVIERTTQNKRSGAWRLTQSDKER